MLSNSTKSKHKKHFTWQDLKPVTSFPEYLWVCGPVRWMRDFYNNLGLYFTDDDKGFHGIEWSQFWPPRVWMLRNFLLNSGLTKRSRVLYRLYKYLHRRVMEELDCHS